MRLLVIGASGLVGSHLLAEARSRQIEAVGTYRTHPNGGLVPLDLADTHGAISLLDRLKPTAVIHAAGWTWADGCERDPARSFRENAEQPGKIAQLCAERGIRMVYISSSYVFDGSNGPYTEAAVTRPINVYGQSKRAGEEAVLAAAGNLALIPRVICVWGHESQKKNFVYQVLDAIQQQRQMRIPSDQRGNPTWAGDIAAWTIDLLASGESGIWHLGGEHRDWTREQWLQAILAGLSTDFRYRELLKEWRYVAIPSADYGQVASRPLHAGIVVDRIMTRFPRTPRAPSSVDCLIAV